jgi:adenylate cyclase
LTTDDSTTAWSTSATRSGTPPDPRGPNAANVGDRRRFEYTVIGDPVKEAGRLAELAKSVQGGLVASGRCLAAAGPDEAGRWTASGEAVLRGRGEPTQLAVPR